MRKNYLRIVFLLAVLAIGSALFAIHLAGALRTFEISPNPMEANTTVSLEFVEPVNVHVFVEDRYGNNICTLYNGAVEKGIVLPWDRLNNNGEYTPNGKYSVVVAYYSRYTSTKKTLILK